MQLQEYNKRTASKAVVSLSRTWLHYLRSICGLQLLTMLSDFCSAFCEFSDDVSTRYRWPWSISWYCLVVVNSFTACFWPGYSDWCRCILRQIICGCFFVGPGPVHLVALLLWRRNASLAGGFAGRPCLCFCGFVWWFALLQVLANWAVYPLFHRLCRYQDRATEHLRPNSRKKKIRLRRLGLSFFLCKFRGLLPGSPLTPAWQCWERA